MGDSKRVKAGKISLQVKGFLNDAKIIPRKKYKSVNKGYHVYPSRPPFTDPPTSERTQWQVKFCVLYDKSSDRHPRVDLYDSRDAFDSYVTKGKRCDKHIELQAVKYIKQSTQTGSKGLTEHQIELKCRSGKYILLLENERDQRDWYTALNSTVDIPGGHDGASSSSIQYIDGDDDDDGDEVITINQMYESSGEAARFEVEVQQTPLATLCGIVGRKILLVSGTDMAFEDPNSKFITSSFQLAWLRRFGVKNGMFTFEVGRRCPNGEGSINCQSAHYKVIHSLVTKNSSSNSKLVTKGNVLPSSIKKGAQALPAGIGEPTLLANGKRTHPGQAKTAPLIPLPVGEPEHQNGGTSSLPKRGNEVENSLRVSGKGQEPDQKQNDDFGRRTSIKHGPGAETFAKELNDKLHNSKDDVESKPSVMRRKDENDVKADKKDRKSRKKEEQLQKAKAKEEEQMMKAKAKEEQLQKAKAAKEENAKKKKTKKEKDQGKGSTKASDAKPASLPQGSLYEEVDPVPVVPSPTTTTPAEPLYDEAVVPTTKTPPKPMARPQSTKPKVATSKEVSGGEYESNFTSSVKHAKAKAMVEPVEYAQPYSKAGGVEIPSEPVMYSDVKEVKQNAWKDYGRKDSDEHFEEDYSNLKNVRDELVKNPGPPPVPKKNYPEEDDETYDNLNTRPVKPAQTESTNIYGTASAHSVGPLPVGVPDRRSPDSDSGESDNDADNDVEDDPHYEGYEDPKVVAARSNVISQKVTNSKLSVKASKQPEESLYDEVS